LVAAAKRDQKKLLPINFLPGQIRSVKRVSFDPLFFLSNKLKTERGRKSSSSYFGREEKKEKKKHGYVIKWLAQHTRTG